MFNTYFAEYRTASVVDVTCVRRPVETHGDHRNSAIYQGNMIILYKNMNILIKNIILCSNLLKCMYNSMYNALLLTSLQY